VINNASMDGLSTSPWETYSYQAAKAGLIHLTRRMATRLIEDHIVMSGIAPGAFASDMNVVARDQGEDYAKTIPARRIGADDDIGAAAVYLAARAGDYVVGHTLTVDGGMSLTRN
jgi:NAD(P)-dependent dehydrogenase (short-subunit alcohol dehydrogenase family)